MAIYIINLLLIGLYATIYKFWLSPNKNALKYLLILCTAQLVLIIGLKNIWIGSDMPFYWDYFHSQMPWSLSELMDVRYELGFKALTKLITDLTQNKQIYLLIIAVISTIPVGYIAYKYSRKPFLTIFLYISLGFFAFNFSGLRQAMALGITLFSLKYLIESKPIKFVCAVGLASLFHFSAIFFLAAYIVKGIRLTNGRVISLGLLAAAVYAFKDSIFLLFNTYFYQSYEITPTDSYRWMTMCIAIVIICLFFYNKVVVADEKKRVLYNLCIVGAFLMLFSPIASNVLRVSNYYFIYIILLVPTVLDSLKYSRAKTIILGLVLLAGFMVYLYLLGVDDYSILPYKFFWEK